ncbi:MAG: sulfotransferase [Arcobacteraceae bacterium]|jgi:hypothetical protein
MPFFILGNPRSGTSMFRLMLNAHSKITVPPESGFALWFAEKYKNIIFDDDKLYEEFVSDLFTAKKFETWGLDSVTLHELIKQSSPKSYQELVALVYKAYALKQNKNSILFGDKNNYYINHVDELINLFHDTKLVFIIRDGRDVAVSYKQINENNINSAYRPVLPTTIKEMAEEWIKNAHTLKKYLNSSVPSMYIRYEDLLVNPKKTITQVLDFLGLEYESLTLEFYKSNDEPTDFLQWKGKTTKAIDAANHSKYKLYLTEQEIREYESIAKNTLKSFAYTL